MTGRNTIQPWPTNPDGTHYIVNPGCESPTSLINGRTVIVLFVITQICNNVIGEVISLNNDNIYSRMFSISLQH